MTPSRIATALVIVSSIVFGVHYYLWARLVRDPAIPAPLHGIATWCLVALGANTVGSFLVMRLLPRSVAAPFLWAAYVWMGLMFYLFLLLVASDIAMLLMRGAEAAGLVAVDAGRRLALARIVAGAVGVATVVITGVGTVAALAPVPVKRVRIPLAKLAPGTPPYRIVQLSDLHLGPTLGERFVRDVVREVNALAPDCVVITGDLVDGSPSDLGAAVSRLAELHPRDGVFFVTGNHEYYSGVDAWIEFLRKLGVRVLRNERVAVGPFDLAGVDDWSARSFGGGHGADVPRALAGRDASRPVVLLAHQPQAVTEAESLGVDLQLSGHTHGGQMFPWNYAVKLVTPYVAGLYQHKRTALYVSRGTGTWGPPMRVGAPPEITQLDLVTA